MKRKTVLVSLVLSIALVFGAFQAAFAGYGITGTAPDGNEYAIDKATVALYDDALAGKYNIVGTDELAGWVNAKQNILIIDTMPATSYNGHHVPGAINIECGDNTLKNGNWDESKQGGALLAAAKQYSGTKQVKYYWNAKKKKWVTKKPPKKYWKKCTKKKDKHRGKKWYKATVDVKDKPIVVYCGFVKCRRSHFAADFLSRMGYTNVYRYPGGISAWGDADPELPYEAVSE